VSKIYKKEVIMLLSKNVNIKWNSRNKKHYEEQGYVYTSMGNIFNVDINHITHGSNAIVDVSCDYCNIIYSKVYCRYLHEISGEIKKDCCYKCKSKKITDTAISKYGVNSIFKLENIKQDIKNTNMHKYGSENVFSSDVIKDKIYSTNIAKYGFKSPQQNDIIRKKTENTCIKRYGFKSFLCTIEKHGDKSPRWKGGFKYHRNERVTYEYNTWRKSVYARDRYRCKKCNNKSGVKNKVYLEAHHILNWKDYVDKRFDIENGITLCDKCHHDFHSLYGKSFNTKLQTLTFINHDKKVR